ncbi:MAG: G1 family glutamic endopeptidase [Actinomycetes bacterium]
MRRSIRLALFASATAASVAVAVPAMATSPTAALASRVGSTLHVAKGTTVNTRTSGNWFGYVQGTLEKKGHPKFTSITGTWAVPTATQHKSGESENSSSWIGIGGGCVNANCLVTDSTLIQTGTEQDVAANGHASYYAWYEIIPAPSLRTPLAVHPGDKIAASIKQTKPEVWSIYLHNLTTGAHWGTVLPYTSSYLTAEWVDETPLTTGGFAALPNLTPTHFDDATVNGVNANLIAAEKLFLTGNNGNVIGAPSAPQADHNGFGDCAWAASCAVPSNF